MLMEERIKPATKNKLKLENYESDWGGSVTP